MQAQKSSYTCSCSTTGSVQHICRHTVRQVLPCDSFSDSTYQQPNTTADRCSYTITDTIATTGAHSQSDKSTFCVTYSSAKPGSDSEPNKSSNDSSNSCPDCEPHSTQQSLQLLCQRRTLAVPITHMDATRQLVAFVTIRANFIMCLQNRLLGKFST